MEEPEYLTPRQVAQRLAVTIVTLRNWSNRGWLSPERTAGGHRRFSLANVKAFESKRSSYKHSQQGNPALNKLSRNELLRTIIKRLDEIKELLRGPY